MQFAVIALSGCSFCPGALALLRSSLDPSCMWQMLVTLEQYYAGEEKVSLVKLCKPGTD